MPDRTRLVAFSVADVYALAEAIRRGRGGAAVVLGALSPRTRNAQVELFQSGAVDFLAATDAIGMGLNMDLDHVAFARLVKFDGRGPRRLTAAEIAQIAGPAGRHIAEARVLKRGRQINFLDATLANQAGKPIATATATIMIAPLKKKA